MNSPKRQLVIVRFRHSLSHRSGYLCEACNQGIAKRRFLPGVLFDIRFSKLESESRRMANQFHKRSVGKQRKVGKQSDSFGASLVWKSLRSSPFSGCRKSDPACGGPRHSKPRQRHLDKGRCPGEVSIRFISAIRSSNPDLIVEFAGFG